jgi:uncharacterized protein (DUF305 family)
MYPYRKRQRPRPPVRHLTAAAALFLLSGCAGTPTASAPAPTPANRSAPHAAAALARYTAADVRFMQGMIAHHRQALEMAALVPERTANEAIRLLAERIDVSQQSEIARMQRWLARRGEPAASGAHGEHHGADHASMPGMLSAEEMAQLAAARSADFDRLFLEGMIHHHEGALVTVDELFAAHGAGQEPELFQLASDVDADQRAEIARMQRLLGTAAAVPDTR